MAREKTAKEVTEKDIVYSKKQWQIFERLRNEAKEILQCLKKNNIEAIIHGSLARGDVNAKSDIDVFIIDNISSFKLEMALEQNNILVYKKEIVQATAWQLIKSHYHINDYTTITFPLVKPKKQELDFYHFGGAITYNQIKKNMRVAGIDKRLMVIIPKETGHTEYSLIGNEKRASKDVKINQNIINERIDVLKRRDRIGRAGVFLKKEVPPDMSVEQFFKYLADRNPSLKRYK